MVRRTSCKPACSQAGGRDALSAYSSPQKDVMKYEPLRVGFTILDLKEQVYHRRVR